MVHGSGQRLFLPLALFSPTASISYLYSRRDIICAPLLHYALRTTHYSFIPHYVPSNPPTFQSKTTMKKGHTFFHGCFLYKKVIF